MLAKQISRNGAAPRGPSRTRFTPGHSGFWGTQRELSTRAWGSDAETARERESREAARQDQTAHSGAGCSAEIPEDERAGS